MNQYLVNKIKTDLIKLIVDNIDSDVEINPDLSHFDMLDMIELIMLIESKFNITLDDSDFDNVVNINQIVSIIYKELTK